MRKLSNKNMAAVKQNTAVSRFRKKEALGTKKRTLRPTTKACRRNAGAKRFRPQSSPTCTPSPALSSATTEQTVNVRLAHPPAETNSNTLHVVIERGSLSLSLRTKHWWYDGTFGRAAQGWRQKSFGSSGVFLPDRTCIFVPGWYTVTFPRSPVSNVWRYRVRLSDFLHISITKTLLACNRQPPRWKEQRRTDTFYPEPPCFTSVCESTHAFVSSPSSSARERERESQMETSGTKRQQHPVNKMGDPG